MGINKVVYGNTTLIDITDTNALATDVLNSKWFYTSDGTKTQGTATGSTSAISVVDTTDTQGGTIRTITALNISDTTAVAADVAQGKYFYTAQGVKTAGTGSGGSSGATQHTIHLEFTDSTDTDIEVDYDDALIATMITSYDPVTYGGKTVDSAALDNVIWYQRPTETWETVYDNDISWYTDNENDYPYCWVSLLSSVSIPNGSVWRITFDNAQYRCTAAIDSTFSVVTLGNPKWGKGTDDGTNVPFCFNNQGWGAWTGSLNKPNTDASYHFKIEQLVTA